jgi:hypothetical protein
MGTEDIVDAVVLIYVNGGVAEWVAEGGVEVHLLDSDNIKAGDPPVKLSGRALAMARHVDPDSEGQYYVEE